MKFQIFKVEARRIEEQVKSQRAVILLTGIENEEFRGVDQWWRHEFHSEIDYYGPVSGYISRGDKRATRVTVNLK